MLKTIIYKMDRTKYETTKIILTQQIDFSKIPSSIKNYETVEEDSINLKEVNSNHRNFLL